MRHVRGGQEHLQRLKVQVHPLEEQQRDEGCPVVPGESGAKSSPPIARVGVKASTFDSTSGSLLSLFGCA